MNVFTSTFDINFVVCDVINDTGCEPPAAFSPTWSSTSALSFSAFIYMDTASGVSLPSITGPSEAFDASTYYHDLHVVPTSAYPACDPICKTSTYKVDGSHAYIELVDDLNTLTIGQAPTMNVKAGLTDTSLVQSFYAIWVIKDATDTSIVI